MDKHTDEHIDVPLRCICFSFLLYLIISTHIDAGHKCWTPLSSPPHLPSLACTHGSGHEAHAREAVGVPQAVSSPLHPSSGRVGIAKRLQARSNSWFINNAAC